MGKATAKKKTTQPKQKAIEKKIVVIKMKFNEEITREFEAIKKSIKAQEKIS